MKQEMIEALEKIPMLVINSCYAKYIGILPCSYTISLASRLFITANIASTVTYTNKEQPHLRKVQVSENGTH